MRIVDRKFVDQNISDTRTIQHFGHLLGEKPHKLGQAVTLYPNLAIANLTDSLRNIYTNQKKRTGSFTPINSMAVEWKIDVNFIKTVTIVDGGATGTDVGLNKAVFQINLEEKYYDKGDTFTLENKQQLFVVAPPRKLAEKSWAHNVILVGNDLSKSVNGTYLVRGKVTRYRSNYFPELSERGYTKYTKNTELHRNYLSRHRSSVDWSGDYAMRESVYIADGKKTKGGGKQEWTIYQMNKKEKDCLDHYLLSRENSNLFSETNYDEHGKCLDQDEFGRDVPMGDGIIPQIERYCEKYAYSNLSSEIFEDVIAAMVEKCDMPTGNKFACVCNERFWVQFGRVMREDLRFQSPSDGTYFYSKAAGGDVKVGATFRTYEFQGNSITFMPDRALSQEYDNYGYAVFLDTGADISSGVPNISSFTLEGAEMLSGNLRGMGGMDGKSTGDISTSVHGSSYHLLGYSCTCVMNPYKSFILKESAATSVNI